METRMQDSIATGLMVSTGIALLAKLAPPMEALTLSPELWWFLKAAGGVVVVESLRRAFVVLILDRFFPDRAAAARLTWWQRWKSRHARTSLHLTDDDDSK